MCAIPCQISKNYVVNTVGQLNAELLELKQVMATETFVSGSRALPSDLEIISCMRFICIFLALEKIRQKENYSKFNLQENKNYAFRSWHAGVVCSVHYYFFQNSIYAFQCDFDGDYVPGGPRGPGRQSVIQKLFRGSNFVCAVSKIKIKNLFEDDQKVMTPAYLMNDKSDTFSIPILILIEEMDVSSSSCAKSYDYFVKSDREAWMEIFFRDLAVGMLHELFAVAEGRVTCREPYIQNQKTGNQGSFGLINLGINRDCELAWLGYEKNIKIEHFLLEQPIEGPAMYMSSYLRRNWTGRYLEEKPNRYIRSNQKQPRYRMDFRRIQSAPRRACLNSGMRAKVHLKLQGRDWVAKANISPEECGAVRYKNKVVDRALPLRSGVGTLSVIWMSCQAASSYLRPPL